MVSGLWAQVSFFTQLPRQLSGNFALFMVLGPKGPLQIPQCAVVGHGPIFLDTLHCESGFDR